MSIQPDYSPRNLFYENLALIEQGQQTLRASVNAIGQTLPNAEDLVGALRALHRGLETVAEAQHAAANSISREMRRGNDLQVVALRSAGEHPWTALFAGIDEEGGYITGSPIGEFLKEASGGRESLRWLVEGQSPKREHVDAAAFAAAALGAAPKYGLDQAGLTEGDYLLFHAATAHALPALRARLQWARSQPSTP
jgi:hypothetical protein